MNGRLRMVKNTLALFGACFFLLLEPACVQQKPLHRDQGNLFSGQKEVPFHLPQTIAEDANAPRVPSDSKNSNNVPFHMRSRRVLPSGTLLTVQLDDSLFVKKVRAGNYFPASVAEPFTVAGQVLIDRGTPVVGQVESTQFRGPRSAGVAAKGYFQLSLTTMTVEGRPVALQTTSLFTRGIEPSSNGAGGVHLPKGRRLTFRLTAPAVLGEGGSVANRGFLAPSSE
jgi:hypothetical protein